MGPKILKAPILCPNLFFQSRHAVGSIQTSAVNRARSFAEVACRTCKNPETRKTKT